MPGPKSGVHGLTCVGREGTACTKVVLQSRVVIRRWLDDGLRSYSSLALGERVPVTKIVKATTTQVLN